MAWPRITRWTRVSRSSLASPTPNMPGSSSPTSFTKAENSSRSQGYANDLFTDRAVDYLKRHRGGPLPSLTSPPTSISKLPLTRSSFTRGSSPRLTPTSRSTPPMRRWSPAWTAISAVSWPRSYDLKLADNTIVLFTSDHGATFESGNQGTSNALDSNHPFRGQKRTLWEGGVRVPGIVRWPGHVPAGKVSDEVIIMTDLFPTLLATTGSTPEATWKVDGLNVLPAWLGQGHVPERTLFWEWRSEGSNQIAAMRGQYKLVGVNNGSPELFNVEADPGERRNIIAEHGDLANRLKAELKAWLATETRE